MPSIKDFDKKNANKKNKPKRRPGRDESSKNHSEDHLDDNNGEIVTDQMSLSPESVEMTTEESSIKVVDVESGHVTEAEFSEPNNLSSSEESPASEHPSEEKIEINFPGSELVRSRFPKPFEVAEKVATEWVKDGDFQNIDVGSPLVQFVTAKGLRQAKDLEKKVLNSPVTEKVAMQVLTTGMKAQGFLQDLKTQVDQIRSKIKK